MVDIFEYKDIDRLCSICNKMGVEAEVEHKSVNGRPYTRIVPQTWLVDLLEALAENNIKED